MRWADTPSGQTTASRQNITTQCHNRSIEKRGTYAADHTSSGFELFYNCLGLCSVCSSDPHISACLAYVFTFLFSHLPIVRCLHAVSSEFILSPGHATVFVYLTIYSIYSSRRYLQPWIHTPKMIFVDRYCTIREHWLLETAACLSFPFSRARRCWVIS